MILFKPFVEVPEDFIRHHGFKQIITYNLSSYIGGFPELGALLPNPQYMNPIVIDGPCDTIEFDAEYAKYITSEDNAFLALMSIVLYAFNDPETLVQILIQKSVYRDCITEALIKVIQQRYGYNSYMVNTMEDMYYVRDDSTFSIPGLFMMNGDLERYALLIGPTSGELNDES